jgi:hypothetical protein
MLLSDSFSCAKMPRSLAALSGAAMSSMSAQLIGCINDDVVVSIDNPTRYAIAIAVKVYCITI